MLHKISYCFGRFHHTEKISRFFTFWLLKYLTEATIHDLINERASNVR